MKTKYFRTVLTSLTLSAMLAISVITIGTAVAQPAPKADPVMTEELMARLIKRTFASTQDFFLAGRISAVFGLTKSGQDLPGKQVRVVVPEGKHLFVVLPKKGSEDVLLSFKTESDNKAEIFLTDKTGVLRAAAIEDASGLRLITNEQAAKKFSSLMLLWAKLADDLPPIETVAPAKK